MTYCCCSNSKAFETKEAQSPQNNSHICVGRINVRRFTDPFDTAICIYILVMNFYANIDIDGNTAIIR